MPSAKITAVGTCVPGGVLTNSDLEKLVETSNEWILTRTGIRERRVVAPEQATSDIALAAARAALAQRGIDASEIEVILVCTVTPDFMFPATACIVQDKLGARSAWGYDIMAACSGFLYGLTTAASLVRSGAHKKVLVIGADAMTRIIDYKDRSTCVLFGDGAGAFIVEAGDGSDGGFIDSFNEIDGSGGDSLKMPGGGSRIPASAETVAQRLHYVHQDGQSVFKFAVRKMEELCTGLLKRNNVDPRDISLLIPHQANRRIIMATAERLGMGEDRVIINIDRYGNTTAGTIPLATGDALSSGKLKKGDIVLFAAVGAGFTAGASLWRWSY